MSFAVMQASAAPYIAPLSTSSAKTVSSSSLSSLDLLRNDLLKLVNAERAKVKAPALKKNLLLQKAAQQHADDMGKRNYLSHTSPEKKTPVDRIKATGYLTPCTKCLLTTRYAENIGSGQKTAIDIVNAWKKSAEHRKNILDAGLRETGIGYSNGKWVMVFGTVIVK